MKEQVVPQAMPTGLKATFCQLFIYLTFQAFFPSIEVRWFMHQAWDKKIAVSKILQKFCFIVGSGAVTVWKERYRSRYSLVNVR